MRIGEHQLNRLSYYLSPSWLPFQWPREFAKWVTQSNMDWSFVFWIIRCDLICANYYLGLCQYVNIWSIFPVSSLLIFTILYEAPKASIKCRVFASTINHGFLQRFFKYFSSVFQISFDAVSIHFLLSAFFYLLSVFGIFLCINLKQIRLD